jgi:gliding motility-associated-like protein
LYYSDHKLHVNSIRKTHRMKKLFTLLSLCFFGLYVSAQVTTAKDCTAAVNVCTSNSFSVQTAGAGFVDFTTSNTVSNPITDPPGVVPPGGSGCLKAGELNPTWMIINIQTPGTLEFSMGAGTGPGAQSGCYDWIMWPYNPSTTCNGINLNTLAPVRCCWNNNCSGGTGLASAANLPAGGFADDYGAPLNVNCGDKFIMCFSNYSSVTTLVPLNFFGTAIVSCSSISNTLAISGASICPGSSTTLSVSPSPGTSYTWQPGGSTSSSITVNPSSSTTYTLNASNSCGTLSGTTAVYVSPAMNLSINTTSGTCSGTPGSATVSVSGGSPGYSYTWSPGGGNTNNVGGLTTGTYSVTVQDALGCAKTESANVVAPAPISFSLNTATGGTLLACNPPTLTINAVNTSTLTNVTYTWAWPSGSATGSSIVANSPGTYTVFAQDQTVGSCTDVQFISIGQNTAVPGVTVNPIGGTLTCGGPPVTFTAISSSTTNIVGQWYDAAGNSVGPISSTPLLYAATAPGTYSVAFTNSITGCVSSQTVSVAANTIVPTMTINTPTGTKITCATPVLTLNISASALVGPPKYVWTHPSTGTVNSVTGGYSVNAPGTYTATFTDGNNCSISQPVVITIDTVKPSPTAITNLPSNSFTLNCYNPVLTASAVTTPMLPVSSYSWIQPSPSLVVATHTMEVTTGSVTANPTTFTVLAAGANGCVGRSKVLFYEDLNVPAYKVVFTPTSLTCSNLNVALSVVNTTTTGPTTFTISSPAPTTTANTPGSLFNQSGVYTATLTNLSNGCTFTATPANVPQNTVPPATVATQYYTLPCGSPTVTINAGLASASSSYSYAWSGPNGAGIGSPSKSVTTVDMPGYYVVSITNTVNGCRSTNIVSVGQNSVVPVSFTADPVNGFAPLTVNVVNTTSLGTVGGSVTTTWSYGNGSTYSVTQSASSTSLGLPGGSTVYNAAGIYTITLFMQAAGTTTCVGTSTAVITVDNPSALIVPNVFTPNGDGVNDRFMVNSTNLTEITCVIFDRWGVKMYDVTSNTGNIGWDGKNLSGKEVPVGTYFYILTATGKEGTTYEQKGTVSLYR